MEQRFNTIPPVVKKCHIIAICGTGMGALACMLKEMGIYVTGSDQQVYPPMSTFLADRGIVVQNGFAAAHVGADIDLVIVGNAVRKDNPEALETQRRGLCYCSMPQALNHFAAGGKKVVLVTGTHGKTTTAALAAWLLTAAGRDPSFMVGGILRNFDSNYRLGNGDCMVIEGDEYDTAFFDKGPKFMHYRPNLAVLTGIEFDHADIFEDIDHVRAVFRRFVHELPATSSLFAYDADANIDRVIAGVGCRVERYGRSAHACWRSTAPVFSATGTSFRLEHAGKAEGTLSVPLLGAHNLANTLAVVALAHHLNISWTQIAEGLRSFKGVKRRQEVRGTKRGVTVLDDFAHHPTAVRETLAAIRPAAAGRLIAVFEPRTNTSMRNVFQADYARAFDAADMVCVRHPPLLDKIPQGARFSSETLAKDLEARGIAARFFVDTDAIVAFLSGEARAGDTVLVMSNGGFDNIHQRLLDRL